MRQGSWKSRKLFVVAVAFAVDMALALGVDPEVAKLFGAFITALAGAYVFGQSYADGKVAEASWWGDGAPPK